MKTAGPSCITMAQVLPQWKYLLGVCVNEAMKQQTHLTSVIYEHVCLNSFRHFTVGVILIAHALLTLYIKVKTDAYVPAGTCWTKEGM